MNEMPRLAALRQKLLVQGMARIFGSITIKEIMTLLGVGLGTASRLKDAVDRLPEPDEEFGGDILSFVRGQGLAGSLHARLAYDLGVEIHDLQTDLEPVLDEKVVGTILRGIRRRQALSICTIPGKI